VSLSLEIDGETVNQVQLKIKNINTKAKIILLIAVMVVVSFVIIALLKTWESAKVYNTKGFRFAIKMVY